MHFSTLRMGEGGGCLFLKLHFLAFLLVSFLCFSSHVANRLKKLQWDFLWHGNDSEFRCQLEGWNWACSLIKYGELGVKKITTFNKALLVIMEDHGGTREERPFLEVSSCFELWEIGSCLIYFGCA